MTAGQVECCVDAFLEHWEPPFVPIRLMVVRAPLWAEELMRLVDNVECRVQLLVSVGLLRETASCRVVQRPRWQLWQQQLHHMIIEQAKSSWEGGAARYGAKAERQCTAARI